MSKDTEIKKLTEFFENEDFNVHLFEKHGEQCAEIEKWTNGGVDMILCLQPFNKKSFFDIVDDFDVDEEIDLHRQGQDYKNAFTISESLKDFNDFKELLKNTASKLKKVNLD